MGKYIISVGHTASGNLGSGASDLLDESNCTREISPLVVKYLQKEGHEAYLLRVDKSNSYNFEDCYVRANQANDIGGDLFVEIHLNSGKERTGDGVEVCVNSASGNTSNVAQRVVDRLSNVLNIDNRGLKEEKLIVLRKTNMPAILVECMFVDTNNINNYNADVIAKAIAEGILDKDINTKPVQGWNKSKDGTKWWYCTDVDNGYYYKSEWKFINSEYYSFNDKGYAKQSEWELYKSKWYYLKDSCKMAKTEWLWIDGECYYFFSDGIMASNILTPDGYTVCSDGSWDESIPRKIIK